MIPFALASLCLAAVPFSFNDAGKALPLPPTQFALLYDDAGNMQNPAVAPERARNRNIVLARIEARKPKMKEPADRLKNVLEQTDDLLAVGKPAEAIDLLAPFSRDREPDFMLMANLVRAYAQAGDWDGAMRSYEFLLDSTPPSHPGPVVWRANLEKKYRPIWLRYHRDIARNKPDPTGLKPIPLFKEGELPADAVAIVQQLALDSPADLFLLWSLAEVSAQTGDFRTAEQLLNRCANSGLTQPKALMAKRAEVQDIVEKLPKPKEEALVPIDETPPPEPVRKGLFDLVEPWKFFALTGTFAVVAGVLLLLQLRSRRRKRLRAGRRKTSSG